MPQPSHNPLELLRHDHRRIKDLFEAFQEGDSLPEQKEALEALISEIRIHTQLAERIFYPAVRQAAQIDHLLDSAQEGHLDMAVVIEDLQEMEQKDPLFADKLLELEDKLDSHIVHEESEIFPEAESVGLDLEGIGKSVRELRNKLAGPGQMSGKTAPRAKQKLPRKTGKR